MRLVRTATTARLTVVRVPGVAITDVRLVRTATTARLTVARVPGAAITDVSLVRTVAIARTTAVCARRAAITRARALTRAVPVAQQTVAMPILTATIWETRAITVRTPLIPTSQIAMVML